MWALMFFLKWKQHWVQSSSKAEAFRGTRIMIGRISQSSFVCHDRHSIWNNSKNKNKKAGHSQTAAEASCVCSPALALFPTLHSQTDDYVRSPCDRWHGHCSLDYSHQVLIRVHKSGPPLFHPLEKLQGRAPMSCSGAKWPKLGPRPHCWWWGSRAGFAQ